MGCLECVLKSLNFVDLTVAAAVCAGTAYSIWHLHNESPSWVYGPILAADALFAFSTLLSWFTLSCHLAACAWHWSALLLLPDSASELTVMDTLANVTLAEARRTSAMETWLQYFESTFAREEWPSVGQLYTASMYL